MKNIILTAIMLLLSNLVFSQQYEISGKIINIKGEPVSGAVIHTTPGNQNALSTQKGTFRINGLKRGNYKIVVSYVGYKIEEQNISIPSNSPLVITLTPGVEHLQEVLVEDHHASERRREEAQNIEIVNHQFIEQNMGGSLMQSLRRLPGVSSMDIGAGISKPVLRGLSFNRVVVAENGIKHEAQQWGADHGLEINQHSISEAEVIKGAASLMYGSDAIGGVINLKNSFLPSQNSFGGDFNLLGESINDKIGTSLNLFGRKEKSYFNAKVNWSDYGDYKVPTDVVYIYDAPACLKDNMMRNTAGEEASLNVILGVKTDSLHSLVNLSVYHAKSGFFANAHGLEPRNVDTAIYDRKSRDIQLPYQQVQHLKASYFISIQKQRHHFELNVGWQNNLREERGPYTNHGYMLDSLPTELGIPETRERWFDKHTATLHLSDKIKTRKHEINIGLQSQFQINEIGGWNFIIPAYNQLTSGLFIYDKWKISEKLITHAGIRYDIGFLNTKYYQDWFRTPIENEFGGTDSIYLERAAKLDKQFDNISYSAGINYNLTHFEFKANAGRSFRMPTAKELAANGVNYHQYSYDLGNDELSPEISYQLDFSGEVHYPLWAFQVSPFMNYFPNYIYLNPTPFFDFENGAGNQIFEYRESEVLRFGGEIHGHYKLMESLKLGVIGEYIFARQLSGAKKGYSLPFSAPATLLVNLKYTPNWSNNLNGTFFSVDYKLTAEQNRTVPPIKTTPGYALVNLSMGTKIKWNQQWVHFTFRVNNLFDKKYLNHTSYYRLISLPEPGINFSASVKIPFTL
jgi:iron complex outermembrane receptor protein